MARKYEVGAGSRCVLGIQSGFGTPQSTASSLLNMRSESITVNVTKTAEDNLFENKLTGEMSLDSVAVSGAISTYLRPEFAADLFELTLGKKTGNNFTLADPDDDVKFATVYLERGKECKKYADMAISSLTLRCDAQKTVEAEINWIGVKEESQASIPTVTDFVKKSYKCTDAYLKYKIGSAAQVALPVETLTFTVDNGLSEGPRTYMSTIYADEPSRGTRAATVNWTMPKGTDYGTLKAKLESSDYIELELKFSNGDGEFITVFMPHVSLTSGNANVSGPGLIDASFAGSLIQTGSGEPLTITLTHPSTTV